MGRKFLKDYLFWGFLLWLLGYLLGLLFFILVPRDFIGWVIMPIGILATVIVLFKKIKSKSFKHYVKIGIAWTLIAIILDYVFLVKLLRPQDGYYKFDVYVYYLSTFLLPVLVGWLITKKKLKISLKWQ